MSEVISLVGEAREVFGTGASRASRREGKIPVVVYGKGKDNILLLLEEKEITKYYRKPQYMSQIFEITYGKEKIRVLPKRIDLHPVTEIARHADFVFVDSKTQVIDMPLVFSNKENCIGIKRGGYFNTVRRFLKISCPVKNLPRKIEIDTTKFPIGLSLKASQVELPEGAKLLDNPNFVIASIIGKKGKSSTDEEETKEEDSASQ